ncbi:MAG: SDR family oxidoreductase [Chloroflexi bacterium]|nr:SDR family oxidoreductase [Chloroflexota bacterium]
MHDAIRPECVRIDMTLAQKLRNLLEKIAVLHSPCDSIEIRPVQVVRLKVSECVFRAAVSRPDDVEAMVRKAVDTWGRLDCAHNNAGIAEERVLTADLTEEVWDKTIDINLKGTWLCMKHEIKQMLEQGGGAIVNTSSVVGLAGVRFMPAYVASKHGIIGLTKAAALEYARDDIRVNAVCPGPILTPALEGYMKGNPKVGQNLRDQNPSGRVGLTEEVAQAVVWLCSEQTSYITGHALAVDGGVLAT